MVEPPPPEVGDAFVGKPEMALQGVDHAPMAHGEDIAGTIGVVDDLVEGTEGTGQ